MSTFVRSAIFAAAVLAGLSAVQARDYDFRDNARPLSSYDLNDAGDAREFFDRLEHSGG